MNSRAPQRVPGVRRRAHRVAYAGTRCAPVAIAGLTARVDNALSADCPYLHTSGLDL